MTEGAFLATRQGNWQYLPRAPSMLLGSFRRQRSGHGPEVPEIGGFPKSDTNYHEGQYYPRQSRGVVFGKQRVQACHPYLPGSTRRANSPRSNWAQLGAWYLWRIEGEGSAWELCINASRLGLLVLCTQRSSNDSQPRLHQSLSTRTSTRS
jgi:hypothetical protein